MDLSATAPQLEFWFDFGSNYSYLSMMRIEALAARQGIAVAYRPFLLGPVFKSFGWNNSPFVLQAEKGDYVWRDMVRQCEKFGLPWTRPSAFPRRSLLPARIALQASQQPWMAAFCQRVMQRNFVDDRDIDDLAGIGELLLAMGLPAQALLAQAQGEPAKLALRQRGEEAARRRIFGAPTFFWGDEMFWGNDRLDDALAFAAAHPAIVAPPP